jgi:PEP-CTERM motif
MFGAIAGGAFSHFFALSPLNAARGVIIVNRSILLLSALVVGGAVMGAAGSSALGATITDDVTFTSTNFTSFPAGETAPVDTVTGSFRITFDPTQTYVDETSGITLTGLNITLGSSLGFDYSPTGPDADELFVGGIADTVKLVDFSPSADDFVLQIKTFTASPVFNQVVYAQVAAGDFQFFTPGAGADGSVTVTPVTGSVPEPSTWAMMFLGFAGLGFLGYRQTAKARVAA